MLVIRLLIVGLIFSLIFVGSCAMSNKPRSAAVVEEPATETGSYHTGVYPSAATLSSSKYSQTAADRKVSEAWDYFKTELLQSSGAVLRTDDNTVVSEGQSYGMMLAVQNNDKDPFDKIWSWTKTNMQPGNSQGLFAWKCTLAGEVIESSTAPDADVMIALALFFASHRFGDGASPYNYSVQAKEICDRILEYEVSADNYLAFCTENLTWFSPGYQMPAFYRLLAIYTGEPRWNQVAEKSYDLIFACLKESYGNLANGLVPDHCNKNGSLRSSGQYFYYDAMRTPFFAGQDQVWFGDSRAKTYIDKIIGSFFGPIYNSFGDKYSLDGSQLSDYHVASWVGSFAGAAMAGSSDTDKVNFFNHLMSRDWPSGQYRYYDLCWLNFGLLLCSGNFKIY
jgi:oligosaccharide reducing-end xylanase